MPEVVISDTSVLILLQNIEELDLLKKVYGDLVITTQAVSEEFIEPLPAWITIRKVRDLKYQESLETQLDSGEASVIALAKESTDPLLLLDDLKARKLAHKLKLKYTGTLGVIHKAKQKGIIHEVKPLLNKLLQHNFRISEKILGEFLKLNNENAG